MASFWDWLFGGGKKEAPAPRREAPARRTGGGGSFDAPAPRQQAAPRQQSGGWNIGQLFQPQPQQRGPVQNFWNQAPQQRFDTSGLMRGGGGGGGVFAMSAPARAEQKDEPKENKQADELGIPEPMIGDVDPMFAQDFANVENKKTGKDRPANDFSRKSHVPTEGNPAGLDAAFLADGRNAGSEKKALREIDAAKKTDAREAYGSALGSLTLGEDGRLTWDQYNALTPLQRNAVDANEAIIQAIEADRADAGAGAKPEDWDYDQTVEKLFGKGGGSDTYAPRTVKLLDELGLTNTTNGDLDQYLNGGALISTDDLAKLGADQLPALQQRGTENRSERENNALAFSGLASARAAETLAQGQTLLDTLNGTSGPAVGFNPLDESGATQQLDELYQTLSHRNSDQIPAELIGQAYAELESQYGITRDNVKNYFDTRLRSTEASVASGNQVNLIGTTEGDFLNPEEFRARYYDGGK